MGILRILGKLKLGLTVLQFQEIPHMNFTIFP